MEHSRYKIRDLSVELGPDKFLPAFLEIYYFSGRILFENGIPKHHTPSAEYADD